jgi:hypothetical protein
VRPIAVAATMLLAACGPGAPPESSPAPRERSADAPNREPRIAALAISPSEPTPDDVIAVRLEALDPDQDALEIEVEWYVNGALVTAGPELELEAVPLARGDEVYAIAHVDDGEAVVSEESERIRVQNRPPRVNELRLLPVEATAVDNLMAVATGDDPDGDAVQFTYRWFKNDQPIPGATGATLEAGTVRRGDRVRVEAVPTDGQNEGFAVSSAALAVRNSPPQITSKPSYELRGTDRYEYALAAEDPDGDLPLRYELVTGPAGMKVDVVTGRVVWTIPRDLKGDQLVEIAVIDPQGGEVRQRYTLALAWGEPPGGATPPASRAPESAAESAPAAP